MMVHPELVILEKLVLQPKFSVRTNNINESSDAGKIAPMWEKFYSVGKMPSDGVVYGLYHNYESDLHADYDVSIALQVENKEEGDLHASGRYLKYTFSGEMPQVVIDGWQVIWQYFIDHPEYRRSYKIDFEKYLLGRGEVSIFISIF